MDPLACVSIPAFELQLLIKRYPRWEEIPAAVISEAKPLGRVIAANRAALRGGVRPDMRYAQALSLRPDLQAAVISAQEREAAAEEIASILYELAPGVERGRFSEATVFWLDIRGFSRLYSSYEAWGEELLSRLRSHGFLGACTVGWSRLGTFAASRKPGEVRVFHSSQEELAATRNTEVRYLPLAPFVKERLSHLGIRTVEEFLALPKGGVKSRFGGGVNAIFALAGEGETVPVQGTVPAEANRARRVCMPSLRRVTPILENVGELLREVTDRAARRRKRIRSVTVTLRDEGGSPHSEELTPAEPTGDPGLLKRLCELRLSRLSWEEPVEEISVDAEEEAAWMEQQDLFYHAPRRRPERGRKALSLLQARLGADAVVRGELQDALLPEQSYLWSPFEVNRLGRGEIRLLAGEPPGEYQPDRQIVGGPRQEAARGFQLVRRIREAAASGAGATERTAAAGHGAAPGAPRYVSAPIILSTRWWLEPQEREYRYREFPDGTIEWVYRDRHGWKRQGSVE